MAINKNTFEYQIALLMIVAAGADGNFSGEELNAISDNLNGLFVALKVNQNSIIYLKEALTEIGSSTEQKLVEEINIALNFLKKTFEPNVLQDIYNILKEVASADGLAEDEANFLKDVQNIWKLS